VSHLYRIKCLGFVGVVVWMPFDFTDFKKQHLIVSSEVFCFEVYIFVLLIDHLNICISFFVPTYYRYLFDRS